jgi:hypothetical protein
LNESVFESVEVQIRELNLLEERQDLLLTFLRPGPLPLNPSGSCAFKITHDGETCADQRRDRWPMEYWCTACLERMMWFTLQDLGVLERWQHAMQDLDR